jgi:predicted enzyme related to lactoylglutathione lyase
MTGRLELVAFDAPDIERLAAFYADLLGWEIAREDPRWITMRLPAGQEVAFQLAPDHVPPRWPGQEHPQQFHLDIDVVGLESAVARAVALGATRLSEGSHWVTLADPAGHPFDLCERSATNPATGLWVTIDVPEAAPAARFYSALTGMPITHDGPEGAAIADADKTVFFQPVAGYNPPRWADPAHPQQAHLDILIEDLDAGEALALQLGARRLDAGGTGFRVFLDPAGHSFCLTS